MKKNMEEILDVIIVGAGHGGLSIGYFLKEHNINHQIFERGRIGESWRSQRWNSFALNTPNWMSTLPGDVYDGEHPGGFMRRDEFAAYLTSYANKFKLPVNENTKVTSVKKRTEDGLFEVATENENRSELFICKQLVLASGVMSEPKIPSISQSFPNSIHQLHAATFKDHTLIAEGAVLVVGSGQSGCQITEDLLNSGRKVYLATSRVGRFPRRYRGKDILEWCVQTKFLDVTTESITDPNVLKTPQPQVSGIGRLGKTVSLQDLARQGATILGRLEKVNDYELEFGDSAGDHVRYADEFSENFKKMIDKFIEENSIACEDEPPQPEDLPDVDASCVESVSKLNLKDNNVSTVIWTTGFTSDFSWVTPRVTDDEGRPVHKKGISLVQGIYFIGFPWLKSRKSGLVYGMNEDAKYIAENISRNN